MSDSEGKQELVGIARAVDALFSPPEIPGDDDAGLETPPEPPNVAGDALTGAPVLPDLPGGDEAGGAVPSGSDEGSPEGPPPLPDEVASASMDEEDGPPPLPHETSADEADDGVSVEGPPPLPDQATAPDGDAAADEENGAEPLHAPPPLPDQATAPDGDAADDEVPGGEEERPEAAPGDAGAIRHGDEPSAGVDGPEDAGEPPTLLDDAVDAYLAGDGDRSDEIRRLADEMLEDRAVDPVARAVGRLASAAGEPPDSDILELARDVASPVVLGRLAVHLGGERDEERRQEYFVACRNLGEPMGRAIRNDMAESTDRLARRVHCEALVEMGPVGRAIVEEMVEDENRFLVRNAVAILGDIGGDGAVELVTSALANPDARVRREALRSLAKLGDEDSGDFVLGLLDDSDRDVRIQAAVTAGELHVERALRHVIRLLDDTKDPDEAIPLIRALGHLGDPGAVPSIEKHAVRGLFSKPRTDVRIAAYRALSQIGTPHARRLLNQAVDDKDPEVKAAVKEMLGMG